MLLSWREVNEERVYEDMWFTVLSIFWSTEDNENAITGIKFHFNDDLENFCEKLIICFKTHKKKKKVYSCHLKCN